MRYEFPYNEIEGYLSQQDRLTLKELAERCSALLGAYMEIGSYKGLSACCINEGMPPTKTLYCFDWFEPDKLPIFIANIANAKYPHNIGHVSGDFKNHLGVIKDELPPIAFAFVDHSHTLSDTIAAHEWIWPRLAPGGIVAYHDRGHPEWPEATAWLEALPHKRVSDNAIIAFQK